MTYTLISDIDELVSEKQQLSRGVNDNMSIPNIRDLIESSPASSMQFQRGSNRMMQQQQSADFLMNQFPTKSLRRQQPQASMFEKTPIIEVLKEEIPIIIEEKQPEPSSQKCNDDVETMLKIEEMNTMFKHNINVINDNILLLYKKLHNQDMQLKGIMFILFIILILVIKK